MNSGFGNDSRLDWEAWLAEHGPALLLYARQQVRCVADAEDLVQEAVLEAWRAGTAEEPPRVWRVYAILRHRGIDLARSRERQSRREEASVEPGDGAWFDVSPEERERTMLIQEALKALTPLHREVLLLKVWGNLTFAEVGQTLGIPANTAASRYRNGLAELRKLTRESLV